MTVAERLGVEVEQNFSDTVEELLRILGEGRVKAITLDIRWASIELLDPEKADSPVVLTFVGKEVKGRAPFVKLYDHRVELIKAFREGGEDAYKAEFDTADCLCSFRSKGRVYNERGYPVKKGRTYFVLADVGTADMKDEGEYILAFSYQMDREFQRVLVRDGNQAIHTGTGICLIEAKPTPN